MMKYFVFDFDGVLINSIDECLLISYETAIRKSGKWTFAKQWKNKTTPSKKVADLFYKNRYWVSPPWQYACLLECISHNEMPDSLNSFLHFSNQKKETYASFAADYFETRTIIQNQKGDQWLSLFHPYPDALQLFVKLLKETRAAILSARDSHSIKIILKHLVGDIPDSIILPQADIQKKSSLLLDFSKRRQCPPEEITFIDDYIAHVVDAHDNGFKSGLASWGYIGPTDIAQAASQQIPVLKQETLGQLYG